jgi:hypothetical protein
VPSDANAVRWWHIVGTDNQQAVDERIGALEVDRRVLYRLDLEGVWRQSSLGRKALTALI